MRRYPFIAQAQPNKEVRLDGEAAPLVFGTYFSTCK
jgi:hypothetical protein